MVDRYSEGEDLSLGSRNLDVYMRDIDRFPLLSKAEEYDLAVRMKKGDSGALYKLITSNLRFVVSVAKNYQRQGLPLSDLINEGNIGLIRAAYRFDEKKNFRFVSYAVWYVRQAILSSLAEKSRISSIPLNKVGLLYNINKDRARAEQVYKRPVDHEDIAGLVMKDDVRSKKYSSVGCQERSSIEKMIKMCMENISSYHLSLDVPIHSDEGDICPLIEKIADRSQAFVKDRDFSLSKEVKILFRYVDKREKDILAMYFGIDSGEPATLEEIGASMGLTRERVRQLKERALNKIRSKVPSKDIKEVLSY